MSGDHKHTKNSGLPSVNGLVEPLVEALIRDAAPGFDAADRLHPAIDATFAERAPADVDA